MDRFWGKCSIFLLAVLFFLANAFADSPRRVIIDTDPGIDDAMAILLALNSPELKVEALTVVPGNVDGRQGLENALKLVSPRRALRLGGGRGARHPLNSESWCTAQYWHGKNGLAGVDLPASKCKADSRFGPDLIIELVHQYPHEITLDSDRASHQHRTGGFERPVDRVTGQRHRHHGRFDHRRECRRRGGSKYLRGPRSGRDCIQCRVDGYDGWLRRGRAHTDHP